MRGWRSYETISGYDKNKSGNWFHCDACLLRVYGGNLAGQKCQNCYGNYAGRYLGKGVYEKEVEVVKRAGSSGERNKRFSERKEKKPPLGSLKS